MVRSLRASWSGELAEASPWTMVIIVLALVAAGVIDSRVLTPFVMTPLYAVPVLIAAWRLGPMVAGVVAVLVNLVDVASALYQGTPEEVWPLYAFGLVLVSSLAVLVAQQRRRLVRHDHALAAVNRRLAAQYAVVRGLAEAAGVDDAVERTLRVLGENLTWSAGACWRLDEAGTVLRCTQFWQKPGGESAVFAAQCHALSFRPGIGLPGRVWSGRQPIWLEDVTADANFPRAKSAQQAGFRSAVGFTVHLGDRTLGVIEAFATDVRQPDADLLAALEAIGGQLGQVIERKRAEEEREQVRRIAEERARQLAEYERVIAHDIRQPLTVTRGQAALLRRAIERGDLTHVDQSARSIEVATRRLEALVLDLVRHARAEAARAQLALQPLDLSTHFTVLLQGRSSQETTRVRVEATETVRVLADPDQLDRILENLLSNAEKYSEPASPIRVHIERQDLEALVMVTNQGVGITPEDLPRVFDQGFRTRAAAETTEGWGVGLYITRGLVEAHGGRIWVESNPGRETIFCFTLPLSPP